MCIRDRGKAEPFAAALDAALQAQPGFGPALIAQARGKAGRGDFDGALAMLEDVTVKNPSSEEAFKLKGDILRLAKNQPDQALAAYRQAVKAKPNFVAGQVGVISVLMLQNKLDEATTEIAVLKKIAGGQPQTLSLIHI